MPYFQAFKKHLRDVNYLTENADIILRDMTDLQFCKALCSSVNAAHRLTRGKLHHCFRHDLDFSSVRIFIF